MGSMMNVSAFSKHLAFAVVFLCLGKSLPANAQALGNNDTEVVSRLYKAKAGDAQEQFLLGLMYQFGKGVAQSDKEATHWYGEAAKQGHMQGQLNLGNMYDKGAGVEQSYTEALQWYFKAAKQGSAEAMYFIGSMTYNGDGTKADPKVAMQWFKKSTEYGLAQGQVAYEEVRAQVGGEPFAPAAVPPIAAPSPVPAAALSPATPAHTALPAGGSAIQKGYAVQIGSFKTEAQAQSHWVKLKTQKAEDFGDTIAYIYKKTFESGKVFYRLNAAFFDTSASAKSFCQSIKKNGTDCIVVKY